VHVGLGPKPAILEAIFDIQAERFVAVEDEHEVGHRIPYEGI